MRERPGEVLRADRGHARRGLDHRSRAGPSRDHTERLLRRARVPFERDGRRSPSRRSTSSSSTRSSCRATPRRPRSSSPPRRSCRARGWSSSDVGLNWTRTGFFRIAERMGAVVGDLEEPGHRIAPASRWASSTSRRRRWRAPTSRRDEVPLAIDELTLVALSGRTPRARPSCAARRAALQGVRPDRRGGGGPARARRGHRGDRRRLRRPRRRLAARGGTIDSRGDHRLAMLGAVAGLASPRASRCSAWKAAGVSYPGFEEDLQALSAWAEPRTTPDGGARRDLSLPVGREVRYDGGH